MLQRKLGYVPGANKDVSSSPNSSVSGRSRTKSQQKQTGARQGSKSKQPPPLPDDYFDMAYTTFVRICLQFQLDNHEKYLENFRAAFLFHDNDNDGILSSEEFRCVA